MNAEKFSATELMSLKHSLRRKDAGSVIEKVGAWELVNMSLRESDEQFYKNLNGFIPLLDQAEAYELPRIVHWYLSNHPIRKYLIEKEMNAIMISSNTFFIK